MSGSPNSANIEAPVTVKTRKKLPATNVANKKMGEIPNQVVQRERLKCKEICCVGGCLSSISHEFEKGLACVIIRLAIAEVRTDFGMLVLDEPTTNLDEENSDSLGKALGKMVKRRDEEKFQLVVITRDQNFVDQLSRHTNLQEYYVVERDSLNHSVIRRLNA